MYHSISDDPEPGVSPYYRVTTSPARFAEQMRWLGELGYRGVTLTEGLAWLHSELAVQGSRSDVSAPPPPSVLRTPHLRASGLRLGEERFLNAHRSIFRESISLAPTGAKGQGKGAASAEIGNQQSKIVHSKWVVLTFDDGFRDFYTAAWPVLREHDFTATMFLPTGFIPDSRGGFPRPSDGKGTKGEGFPLRTPHSSASAFSLQPSAFREFLTWNEVRELHEAGIEFGSHTVSHPVLYERSWVDIESEISNSQSEIAHQLGAPVTTFAYPYAYPEADAAFTGRFESLLRAAGYACSVTTRIGRAGLGDNRYALRRLPVNDEDDLALLRAKLEGAYDWLAVIQHASKACRAPFRRRQPLRIPGRASAIGSAGDSATGTATCKLARRSS